MGGFRHHYGQLVGRQAIFEVVNLDYLVMWCLLDWMA